MSLLLFYQTALERLETKCTDFFFCFVLKKTASFGRWYLIQQLLAVLGVFE
jgi:hypothetical protein